MVFVKQRFRSDCAVCCLAMFLGCEYEEIARHCAGHELVANGLTNFREKHIAGLFEVDIVFRDTSMLDRSRKAVLTVPSLNSGVGLTHAVFWDGNRIWDPAYTVAGKKWYTNQMAWEVCIEGYQLKLQRDLFDG